MREDDKSPVKKIVNEDCIMKLARSGSNAVNNDVNIVDSVVSRVDKGAKLLESCIL